MAKKTKEILEIRRNLRLRTLRFKNIFHTVGRLRRRIRYLIKKKRKFKRLFRRRYKRKSIVNTFKTQSNIISYRIKKIWVKFKQTKRKDRKLHLRYRLRHRLSNMKID